MKDEELLGKGRPVGVSKGAKILSEKYIVRSKIKLVFTMTVFKL